MTRETLSTFLDDCLIRGEQTAILHKNGLRFDRWSYNKLAWTACRFSRELECQGINKGDRVLIWAENSPQWLAAFFGCMLRGVVAVPLDAQSSDDFVFRVQQQVKA